MTFKTIRMITYIWRTGNGFRFRVLRRLYNLNTFNNLLKTYLHTMLTDLQNIKDYIVQEIAAIEKDTTFLSNLDDYLSGLISETEDGIVKIPIEIKAGRQLLCCIGIDIKSGLVPSDHYLKIFRNFPLNSYNIQARILFFNCVNDNDLHFRDAMVTSIPEFCIVVFPIRDRDYYIDPYVTGIHSISTIEFMVEELIDYSKTQTIFLRNKMLYKGNEKLYFWTTTESDIEQIKKNSSTPAKDIVDKLGLSHFEFKDDDTKFFCFFNLNNPVIETCKPNATVVNWTGPDVGFLSYKKDIAGRTFSISGYSNYDEGLKERIFNKHTLTDDEHSRAFVSILSDKIDPPIKMEFEELIEEGIFRFNKA